MAGKDNREYSTCSYGAIYIRRSYRALNREARAPGEGEDREQVHRMRVASRRLRAAMPIFASCFEKGRYRKWFSDIRSITAALGRARDLDVQILFLEELQQRAQKKDLPGRDPGESRRIEGGIKIILAGLRRERRRLQPGVEKIGGLLDTGRFREFEVVLAKRPGKREKGGRSLEEMAGRQLEKRIDQVVYFDPWVMVPDAVARHHEMRIAVKKLRYTLEIFDRHYGGFFRKPLRRIKRLQEVLGVMHDCDVWIDWLPGFAGRLIRRRKTGRDDLEAAVQYILGERRAERDTRYSEFVGLWHDLRETNFFPALVPGKD